MKIFTEHMQISTKGNNQIIDITPSVQTIVKKSGINNGLVNIFNVGSTAGITTIEYEPGLLKDLPETFEKIAPMNKRYHHDDTWQDGNGYAHIRASLLGPSITVPVSDNTMSLGTWQQLVLVDFDNRARDRKIICKIMGE
jgi:secondary thiamine-phosphate synthase enzyme